MADVLNCFLPSKTNMRSSSEISSPKVTFQRVEKELRARSFGILGTVSKKGRVHSTGVVYAVSQPNRPLEIYITTRTINRKVRNIAANPNVSFVVPLSRRFLSFVPPSCIQFRGTAEIVQANDEAAIRAFEASWLLRMILKTESDIVARGGGEMCFIRISPDPVIYTYGLGLSLWHLRKQAHNAASKVEIPEERRRPIAQDGVVRLCEGR